VGRSQDQVVFRRDVQARAVEPDLATVISGEVHAVSPVQQLEQGLQFVVTVRPAPGDVQEQVELCR
jgi:hypothetical protein